MIGTAVILALAVVVLGLGVSLIVCGMIKRDYGKRGGFLAPGWTLVVMGGVVTLAWGSTWLYLSTSTYGTVQRMKAFYYDTQSAYVWAVEETQAVTIDSGQTRDKALTDLAYQEQGKSAATRIVEFRDEVAWYNRQLRWLASVHGLPLIGPMFYSPGDLSPIHLVSP